MPSGGNMQPRHVLIAGVTSGIGEGLARLYRRAGTAVTGTYRRAEDADRLVEGVSGHRVDVTDGASVAALAADLKSAGYRWDMLISSIGTLEPIGAFHATDFEDWRRSFEANYFGQLHLVHALRALHAPGATVVFFTGGAPNGVLPRFSAYSVAKIALTKMVEYLDAEDDDIKYAIVGPGWVNTKIHEQTLRAGGRAGENIDRTRGFLAAGGPGTPIQDIYDCINWLADAPKQLVGGRNFSVVWDTWGSRNGVAELTGRLAADPDLFKLRRREPATGRNP